jgi:hypothetical protein
MSELPTRAELLELLSRHPPLDALSPERLGAMIDAGRLQRLPEDAQVDDAARADFERRFEHGRRTPDGDYMQT